MVINDPPLIVMSMNIDGDLSPVFCLRKQEDFYILQEMGYLDEESFPLGSIPVVATLH